MSQEERLKKVEEGQRMSRIHMTITVIDTAHLHEMHEAITAENVNPHFPDRLKKLVTLIDTTPWTPSLESKAGRLNSLLQKLIDQLTTRRIEEAKVSAGEVHGLYHSLVDDFYSGLKSDKD